MKPPVVLHGKIDIGIMPPPFPEKSMSGNNKEANESSFSISKEVNPQKMKILLHGDLYLHCHHFFDNLELPLPAKGKKEIVPHYDFRITCMVAEKKMSLNLTEIHYREVYIKELLKRFTNDNFRKKMEEFLNNDNEDDPRFTMELVQFSPEDEPKIRIDILIDEDLFT